MYLKSLELNGFKSFGKKSLLEFTSPITSIVGPNGSGKSNIAEAFRFVLGEQSLKSMRGKKGEDLIFNGSGDVGRANRAGVKLAFDNSKKLLNVDFDEVTLERVVYRDGINEYFINGSKSRLKDIVELLAGAHIGSSGHHIISQGEADRILHSNPKERREMIEDALGIKIYKYKKDESERKLEKTDENINQVESLRREIAPHLKFLKKQVEKVEKAKDLKAELITKSRIYFKTESVYLDHEKLRIKNEKTEPEAHAKELERKLSHAKRLVESAPHINNQAPEIIGIERNLQEIRTEKDTLTRDLGKIEGEISYVGKALEREERLQKDEGGKTVLLKDVMGVYRKIEDEATRGENALMPEVLRKIIFSIRNILGDFVNIHKNVSSSDLVNNLRVEIQNLELRRKNIESDLSSVFQKEKDTLLDYERTKQEMERAKDETREAEKDIFRIIAMQNEMRAVLEKIYQRERELVYAEDAFKGDLRDVSTLAGVEILRFNEEVLENVPYDVSVQKENKKHIERLKIRLEEMGVGGGDDVIKEYKETEERDVFLAKELVDLRSAGQDLKTMIVELEEKLDVEFKEGVRKINDEFGKFFSMMFGGGHSSLKVIRPEKKKKTEDEMLDGGDAVPQEMVAGEEGLDIEVSLPHKKIKGLMMLSGGERALTSIALLFAISQVNPPPFVILDETDAALDEANSRKYGDMIESLSKHSQLIVITHNRETMSRAGVLYGITMGKDATSKLLSIQFDEAVEVAK